MGNFSATVSEFFYKRWVRNSYVDTTWEVTGTCSTQSKTCFLIGNGSTFITDGVAIGDTVTLDVGGETATVVTVISETELLTTVLSDTGTYDNAEAFTITRDSTAITTGAVAATNPDTYVLVANTATFMTDGVMKGDTVTMDVGHEWATVATVLSETVLITDALSGAGTYAKTETFTIDDGNIYRLVVYKGTGQMHMIRQIIGITDAAAGAVRITKGWNEDPVFIVVFPTSLMFSFDPDLSITDKGVPVIIECDINTEASSSLNVSWEFR